MEHQLSDAEEQVFKSLIQFNVQCKRIFSSNNTDGFHVFLQLYYNLEGKQNTDSMYQNAPVTSEQQETVREDADQSTGSESSCDTEISQSPRSAQSNTYL